MAAADADTPAGNHQGCQMKKYVLTKVINQITARRARPIYNDLQGRFSAHRSAPKPKTADGRKVYHSGLWQVQVASWCARADSAPPSRSIRKLQSFSMSTKARGHGHDTRYVRLQKNYCFACGRNNPEGMRLKFSYDEERDCFVCRFRLGKRFTGPPGHCHGGIIATLLDEAMGKVNKLRHVVALTSEITVKYLKPVPLNKPLRVESREVRVRGRKHVNMAEILNQKGEVLAQGQGLFIAIDPKKMFAKYVDK
jgi:uncharacterized protein (TIGR00369 family)